MIGINIEKKYMFTLLQQCLKTLEVRIWKPTKPSSHVQKPKKITSREPNGSHPTAMQCPSFERIGKSEVARQAKMGK
ncbi:hypothetical protein [Paraglaciecola sp. MB-3u-78]|uniref:hypothetical protein n=1 Tax=Paraglaciecola sp. MB-3u-78 TaxID=2058332 RepID=UPI0012FF1520|nr:hypothetical protein [Paraglaciecola sp. MB-3u-78]